MAILELTIIDSCWVKYVKGLVITIQYLPPGFRPKVDDAITLEDLNKNTFTTTIGGVERFMRAVEYASDPLGILLNGFTEYVDMSGWKALFILNEKEENDGK